MKNCLFMRLISIPLLMKPKVVFETHTTVVIFFFETITHYNCPEIELWNSLQSKYVGDLLLVLFIQDRQTKGCFEIHHKANFTTTHKSIKLKRKICCASFIHFTRQNLVIPGDKEIVLNKSFQRWKYMTL